MTYKQALGQSADAVAAYGRALALTATPTERVDAMVLKIREQG
ncbi:MAG: hypothetical protein R3C14_43245 [Caldilineaceae bacterium]